MTWGLLFTLIYGSGSSSPLYAASNVSVYDVKDFFKNPDSSGYQLSADGKNIAFVKSGITGKGASRLNIYVQGVTDKGTLSGAKKRLTDEKLRDIAGFIWKNSETLLYFIDTGGDENYHVYALNIKTGKAIDLTPFERTRAEVIDILQGDDNHVLISHNQRNPTVSDVYRINIHNGESERVIENPGSITSWLTDHKGLVRLAISTDGLNTTLFYRENAKIALRPLIQNSYKTRITPLFFDTDNTSFYALSNRCRDKLALVLINPTRPDEEKVVYQTEMVDLSDAFYSKHLNKLVAVNWFDEKYQVHFFDKKIAAIYEKLKGHFPEDEIRIQAVENGKHFVVYVSSDRSAGSYYLYYDPKKSLSRIADLRPQLKKADMAPVKPISYTSRDGLTIHGYLTLPVNRQHKNLACIINPHGGPEARDVWEYNPEVQFLASQGYCVLQMNFRGSTGYGRDFWQAGYGQWGLKMQDDITDGVLWLVQQGIADPKRIGIYGTSYGGYAALAGIAFTPDLYAAAVDYVGISSLFTILKSIPSYWKPLLEQQYAMIGHPERDNERLRATSPLLHADKMKTPLFIAQGANDPRVNKLESDQMVAELRKRGITVEYMVKNNEGHGFANEENRIDFYRAMQAFLAKHLKP
jgi:dipeptidyl aminopeptidase/acylaminoacyl peptidase